MKTVALFIGLLAINVAVTHPNNTSITTKTTTGDVSPLYELMQKSFKACISSNVDQQIAIIVAHHSEGNNRNANCLRACVLIEAELINDDTKFNFNKFRKLLKAAKKYTHEMITIYMGLAKIFAKIAERSQDECVVAQIYYWCVQTIIDVKEGAAFPQH